LSNPSVEGESKNTTSSDSVISLADTLSWIKDKVDTNAGLDLDAGSDSYTVSFTPSGKMTLTEELVIRFDDVPLVSTVVIEVSMSDLEDQATAEKYSGADGATKYMVKLYAQSNRQIIKRTVTTPGESLTGKTSITMDAATGISFRDQDLANRVAKAFSHAITIFKSRPEPF
jgi:hypothetical protein